MVRELVVPPQVQRIRILVGHDEAEQIDPEPARLASDVTISVAYADRTISGTGGSELSIKPQAPNRGTCVSPSATCTIRDSV